MIAEPGGHLEPAYLAALAARERVTLLHFVPSMLRAFVDRPEADRCRSLRAVVASGEVLPGELARRCLGRLGAELHNLYGPTEAAIEVSAWRCRPGAAGEGVPIGRPIANVRLAVLDPDLRPAPRGAPGELAIGGAAPARGYRGRPGLSAASFVPDPAAPRPGARLYRTGDLARHRAGGEIEFLGRLDQQVKVRGFRIEPGEIEVALREHPAVARAAVVAVPDPVGDSRLVAYVVQTAGAPAPAREELTAYLARRLPDHMVPRLYVALDELPSTPSGKLDRRALPAPGAAPAGSTAPRTAAEEIVAGLWADVLGLEAVGIEEDFFQLGGHSLLATRVVSRLRRAFGVELPVRSLFEAPTVARLAAAVEKARASGPGIEAPPLVAAGEPGPRPLSFAQERLWFLDRLEPGRATYNVPAVLALSGPLDPASLARALADVAARHETLRTRFVAGPDGTARPEVDPAPAPRLPVVDLGGLGERDRGPGAGRLSGESRRLADRQASRPFDLFREPLLRATLLRLGEGEHVLVTVVHHIVSDGWSLELLRRELAASYRCRCAGAPARLPALWVQYGDYAAWQRAWLRGEVLERELGYWRETLGEGGEALSLPTDRPRPAAPGPDGASAGLVLAPELAEGLRALARREGATVFMVLLAGFASVLGRWAGQDRVRLGTPVAGRTRVETEPLIGLFVNTLVLQVDLAGPASFRDLVGRVRRATLGALAHQEVPFERLVEELAPARSLAHSPLFQAMLALEGPAPGRPEPEDEGLRMRLVPTAVRSVKHDLSLTLRDPGGAGGAGIAGALDYRAELFDRTTMERLAGHLGRLLARAAAEPASEAAAIPLWDRAEEHQVLGEWGAGRRVPGGPGAPVHEGVLALAAHGPEAIAVSGAPEQVSYGELARRAAALAGRLRRAGVAPGALVGLHLEPSAGLVEAMLATLAAGGAYLPLPPELPAERLGAMLADAGARVLLTRKRGPGWLPAGVTVLDLEVPSRGGSAEPPAGAAAAAADLAYVLYTSGSTGRPKGVMIPHGALSNHMAWLQAAYPLRPEDCVLQKTPAGFDASVWEIWAPLLAGARLAVLSAGELRDPARLIARAAAERATVLQVVPSLLQALLERPELAGCRDLARLFVGGEPLPADFRDRSLAALPAEVVNLYGPTEATIDASHRRYRGPDAGAPVAVGRPVDGVDLRIVDRGLGPAPAGVFGELAIGGAGLARGYLGRPGRTAERFVPDPFAASPGGGPGRRLYRSGDLARWLPGGEVELAGRVDRQVKLRGFRLEPGEVEAALRAHPGVSDAAVVAREDLPAGPGLAAYVVAAAAAPGRPEIGPAALRRFLAGRLPAYMVPQAFVELPAFPRTASGKLDARSLPPPDGDLERSGRVAPRDALELALCRIWEDLLGRPAGVSDDFFELGGHSLLGLRLLARVKAELGRELPAAVLFQAPTVEGLAALLRDGGEAPALGPGPGPAPGPAAGRGGGLRAAPAAGPPGGRRRRLLPRSRPRPAPRDPGLRAPGGLSRAGGRRDRRPRVHGARLPRGGPRGPARGAVPSRRLVPGRSDRLRDGPPARGARRVRRAPFPRGLGAAGRRRPAPLRERALGGLRRRPPAPRRRRAGRPAGRRRPAAGARRRVRGARRAGTPPRSPAGGPPGRGGPGALRDLPPQHPGGRGLPRLPGGGPDGALPRRGVPSRGPAALGGWGVGPARPGRSAGGRGAGRPLLAPHPARRRGAGGADRGGAGGRRGRGRQRTPS